jgi:hypothetical protein
LHKKAIKEDEDRILCGGISSDPVTTHTARVHGISNADISPAEMNCSLINNIYMLQGTGIFQ